MKIPKLFHGLKAFDHGSVLMPNTVEKKIEEILESIRPALKADGGDLEFLRFNEEGGVVELRLLGACEDCLISMMTLREGIEQRLKRGISGITEVQAV
jgi:Fe-S cluster biogenesis protein NfuA